MKNLFKIKIRAAFVRAKSAENPPLNAAEAVRALRKRFYAPPIADRRRKTWGAVGTYSPSLAQMCLNGRPCPFPAFLCFPPGASRSISQHIQVSLKILWSKDTKDHSGGAYKCWKKYLSTLGLKQEKTVKWTRGPFQAQLSHGWLICADRPRGFKPLSALDTFSQCPVSHHGVWVAAFGYFWPNKSGSTYYLKAFSFCFEYFHENFCPRNARKSAKKII